MFGRVVGQKFSNVHEIEASSGVVKIRPAEQQDYKDNKLEKPNKDETDLLVIGTKDTVATAILLLDHHINFLKTVNELASEDRNITQQLNQLALES